MSKSVDKHCVFCGKPLPAETEGWLMHCGRWVCHEDMKIIGSFAKTQ